MDSILVFIRLEQSGMHFPWDSCFCFMLKVITWHSDQIGNDFFFSDVQRQEKNLCLVPIVKWLRTVVTQGSARMLIQGMISLTVIFAALVILVLKRNKGITGIERVKGKKSGNEDPILCNGWARSCLIIHGYSLLLLKGGHLWTQPPAPECWACAPLLKWSPPAYANVKGVLGMEAGWCVENDTTRDPWSPYVQSPCLGSVDLSPLFVSLCLAQRSFLVFNRSFIPLEFPTPQQTHAWISCQTHTYSFQLIILPQLSFQKYYLTTITFFYHSIGLMREE